MGMVASWSCDLNHLNKLSFPHPMEASYEIWPRCFKMLTYDGQHRHAYTISSPVSLEAQVSYK